LRGVCQSLSKVEETVHGFGVTLMTFQVLLYHFFSFVNIYESRTF